MKGLLFILVVLVGLHVVRHWGDEPQLLVGAAFGPAADNFCDFPKKRAPLFKPPGLYLPDGEVRRGHDKGIA